MKKLRSLIGSLLIISLLICCGNFNCAYASEESIQYIFSGAEAALPGYAEGSVVIKTDVASGYYHLYWADDDGILDGYEKITTQKITSSGSITYNMPENMAIPEAAKYLAAFFSGSSTLSSTELSDAELYEIPQTKRFDSGDKEMSFASVSDVHVNYSGAPALWTAALNYFNDIGLEMVVISGDCTNDGSVSEYTTYINSIAASNYPEDKIYAARGNHDSQQNANYLKYTSRSDMVRPTENSPWFYVLKKGDVGEKDNLFIFLAQELSGISNSHTQDNFSQSQMDWFEGILKQFTGTNTNIFIAEHGFFHNWGPGDRYNGVYVQPMKINDSYAGNMRFQRLLMEYKEAVLMTGHSHIAYSEMVNYSDENGTACRMIHNSSPSQPRVYNDAGTSIVYGTGGSEAYVVNVYEDDIVYNGTNLKTREKIPTACYIFPSYTEDRSEAESISVTKMPDKTKYEIGDYFDAAGMEITAKYPDGSEKAVLGWGLEKNTALTAGAKKVTIVYGDLKTDVSIKVGAIDEMFDGEGTQENPYIIATASDFVQFTNSVLKGNQYNNTYFKQTADIDLAGNSTYGGMGSSCTFAGNYDGGGHTINANLTTSSDNCIFGYVSGTIINLGTTGTINSTGTYTAGIVRSLRSGGKMANCYSTMSLSGKYAAGLIWSNYGTMINCYFGGTVSGSNNKLPIAETHSCIYSRCYYLSDCGASQSESGTSSITSSVATSTLAETLNDGRQDAATAVGVNIDNIISWKQNSGSLPYLYSAKPAEDGVIDGNGETKNLAKGEVYDIPNGTIYKNGTIVTNSGKVTMNGLTLTGSIDFDDNGKISPAKDCSVKIVDGTTNTFLYMENADVYSEYSLSIINHTSGRIDDVKFEIPSIYSGNVMLRLDIKDVPSDADLGLVMD